MTTKLDDIDIWTGEFTGWGNPERRPATVQDLVDALIAEGGEIKEATTHELWTHAVRRVIDLGRFKGTRGKVDRYLVFPIPDESPEVPR